MIHRLVCAAVFTVAATFQTASAACKPVHLIMTRATSDGRNATTGLPKYPLDTANLANVKGALKYIITETIDYNAGYDRVSCTRKNNVNYIHFYNFTICNPDAALWWFNPSRPAKYGGKGGEKLYEFGAYLTADGGACHDNDYCYYLSGNDSSAKLGSWVGLQDCSDDPRNPTKEAYWYSIMGDCPLMPFANKTADCKAQYRGGQCAPGKVPDGKNCSWSYNYLGQVVLDELVGITSILNNATGKNFTNSTEYCLANNTEFRRDSSYEFVEGLPFWKGPLSDAGNNRRINKLLEMYHKDPKNLPLPQFSNANPECWQTVAQCGDGTNNTEICVRDSSSVCRACNSSSSISRKLRAHGASSASSMNGSANLLLGTGGSGSAAANATTAVKSSGNATLSNKTSSDGADAGNNQSCSLPPSSWKTDKSRDVNLQAVALPPGAPKGSGSGSKGGSSPKTSGVSELTSGVMIYVVAATAHLLRQA